MNSITVPGTAVKKFLRQIADKPQSVEQFLQNGIKTIPIKHNRGWRRFGAGFKLEAVHLCPCKTVHFRTLYFTEKAAIKYPVKHVM